MSMCCVLCDCFMVLFLCGPSKPPSLDGMGGWDRLVLFSYILSAEEIKVVVMSSIYYLAFNEERLRGAVLGCHLESKVKMKEFLFGQRLTLTKETFLIIDQSKSKQGLVFFIKQE